MTQISLSATITHVSNGFIVDYPNDKTVVYEKAEDLSEDLIKAITSHVDGYPMPTNKEYELSIQLVPKVYCDQKKYILKPHHFEKLRTILDSGMLTQPEFDIIQDILNLE